MCGTSLPSWLFCLPRKVVGRMNATHLKFLCPCLKILVVKSEGDRCDGWRVSWGPRPQTTPFPCSLHMHTDIFPILLRLGILELTLGIAVTFPGGCGGSSEWLCLEHLQAWLGPGEQSCLGDGEVIRWGNCILLGRMGRIMLSI